jgi:3-deoxy-D-manno-octulosonate 8-phosphate phosphatase (KDO 8-P phosphatase)
VAENATAKIKLLVSDVDGVLTDGSIIYGSDNFESKMFSVKDGAGIKLAGWCDLPMAWLSGRTSDAVVRRAAELNVHLYQGIKDKAVGLRQVAADHGVSLEEIAYVGDDLNDLPAMRLAGLPIAVADAVPEVRMAAKYVTTIIGGYGAIREVVEYILKGQGRWDQAVDTYLQHLRGARVGQ